MAVRADTLIRSLRVEHLPHSVDSPLNFIFESRERRTVASHERELKRERIRHRRTETELREALAQEEILLRQKDELIQQQEILSKESDIDSIFGVDRCRNLFGLARARGGNGGVGRVAGARRRRACLTRPDWCLLTRPQPTPPWCGFQAAAGGAFGLATLPRLPMLSSANSRAHSARDSSHELRIDALQLATQVARTASSRTSAHRDLSHERNLSPRIPLTFAGSFKPGVHNDL